jgi:hypothetical protein
MPNWFDAAVEVRIERDHVDPVVRHRLVKAGAVLGDEVASPHSRR